MDMDLKQTQEYRMWHAIFEIHDRLQAEIINKHFKETADISLRQHLLMKKVYELTNATPEGISLKDLATGLHLTPGTVSELVETLVCKGALQRVQNPNDRRAVLINVTRKSIDALHEVQTQINQIMEDLWKESSPAEKQAMVELMERLAAKIPQN